MNSLTFLMEKNISEGLSELERKSAEKLIIFNVILTNELCGECKMSESGQINSVMMDYPLCKEHAHHVLITGR